MLGLGGFMLTGGDRFKLFTATGTVSFDFGTTLLKRLIVVGRGGKGGDTGTGGSGAGGGGSGDVIHWTNVTIPSGPLTLTNGGPGEFSWVGASRVFWGYPGGDAADGFGVPTGGNGNGGGGGGANGTGQAGGKGGLPGQAGGNSWKLGGSVTTGLLATPINCLIGTIGPGLAGNGSATGTPGAFGQSGTGYGAGGGGANYGGQGGAGGGAAGILINGSGPTFDSPTSSVGGPGAPGFIYVEY